MKQAEAHELMTMGRNVFLTGAAGTGKTHVLREFVSYLRSRGVRVGVTASTGIAATHMNGVTIHSWSGIGVRDSLSGSDLDKIAKRHRVRKNVQNADVLVIDEISMLSGDLLDMVDMVCRKIREKNAPFGGLQVVLSGDFFQLPPISRGSSVGYAYTSRAWQELDLAICYLDEQYRQKEDDPLRRVLGAIRERAVTEDTLDLLRGRYRAHIAGTVRPTRLFTHNIDVDTVNARELATIDGESQRFAMVASGNTQVQEFLRKSCLAPEMLEVKIGATVMFVKNNYDKGYVNGSLGTVVDFDELDYPVVTLRDGREIIASPELWEVEDDGKVLATVTQVPLRLAWAITVHKSQGMSLDAVEVDLSRAFTPGMGYVALSRARTLDGLRILGFNATASEVDEAVYENDRDMREASDRAVEELSLMSTQDRRARVRAYIAGIENRTAETKRSTFDETKELIEKGRTIEEVSLERKLTVGTILSHLERFREAGTVLAIDHLKPKPEALADIGRAFRDVGGNALAPVRARLKRRYTYEDIRLARLFIDEHGKEPGH